MSHPFFVGRSAMQIAISDFSHVFATELHKKNQTKEGEVSSGIKWGVTCCVEWRAGECSGGISWAIVRPDQSRGGRPARHSTQRPAKEKLPKAAAGFSHYPPQWQPDASSVLKWWQTDEVIYRQIDTGIYRQTAEWRWVWLARCKRNSLASLTQRRDLSSCKVERGQTDRHTSESHQEVKK